MKINVNEEGIIVLSKVFLGIIMETEEGVDFGIAQRDCGIEIYIAGKTIAIDPNGTVATVGKSKIKLDDAVCDCGGDEVKELAPEDFERFGHTRDCAVTGVIATLDKDTVSVTGLVQGYFDDPKILEEFLKDINCTCNADTVILKGEVQGYVKEPVVGHHSKECVERSKCSKCAEDKNGICFDHAPMGPSKHGTECNKTLHLKEELKKGPGEITFDHIKCNCGLDKYWEDRDEEDGDEGDYVDAVMEHRHDYIMKTHLHTCDIRTDQDPPYVLLEHGIKCTCGAE